MIAEEQGPIPIAELSYGEVALPDPHPDVAYIVSILVAQAASNRDDLYVVDEEIRNDQGAIVGAKRIAKLRRSDVEMAEPTNQGTN